MHESTSIDIGSLRIGLHVHLDLGWMEHPFPLSSFRIASAEQIETLRGLGLARVRVSPQRSDAGTLRSLIAEGALSADAAGIWALLSAGEAGASCEAAGPAAPPNAEALERERRRAALEAELASAQQAERGHTEAGRALKRSFELATSQPQAARAHCEGQVRALLDGVLAAPEMAIRLLGEGAGDRACLHAVNVTVISLLLGQQLGLAKPDMFDLGVGAMLHDIGKLELPERVRWIDALAAEVPAPERHYYQEHVTAGVALGRAMQLAPAALLVIAQHHELADGSGFPLRLPGARISAAARIVALVNRYDKLCNPASPAQALTPHEALALLYGRLKAKFDGAVFGAFIRMMGIYPPGSVVQLSDERHALVLAVNAARPLKPRVLVHEPRRPREEALPLELETVPELCIRRSLKPQHLPRAVLDWLSPRPRICYFFERAREPFGAGREP